MEIFPILNVPVGHFSPTMYNLRLLTIFYEGYMMGTDSVSVLRSMGGHTPEYVDGIRLRLRTRTPKMVRRRNKYGLDFQNRVRVRTERRVNLRLVGA